MEILCWLCKFIQSRLNIITCLSNINLEPNTNSLINIIKVAILSKIDYGLVIYGYSNQKNLQRLSSIYNAAIKRALGAFCSTPIKIAESGLPTIIERRELLTGRLITKLSNPNKSIVKTLAKLSQKKRIFRSIKNTLLCKTAQYCSKLPSNSEAKASSLAIGNWLSIYLCLGGKKQKLQLFLK